jgi:hypothetical protein
MGYSRGAYAVRSLAGLIDRMGLLRAAQIDEETLDRVYHLYRDAPESADAMALRRCAMPRPCRDRVSGRLRHGARARDPLADPLAFRRRRRTRIIPTRWARRPASRATRWRWTRRATPMRPCLWEVAPDRAASGTVEQMWFRGAHGDVGGQLDGYAPARPLSNIPLVWMLSEAEGAGLPLPHLWRRATSRMPRPRPPGHGAGPGNGSSPGMPARSGTDPSERDPSQRPRRGQRARRVADREPHRRDPKETLRVTPFLGWRGRNRAMRRPPVICPNQRKNGVSPASASRAGWDRRRLGPRARGVCGYCARMSLRTSP